MIMLTVIIAVLREGCNLEEFSISMDGIALDKAVVTTSWDDGHPLDLKLAELLKKYDVPATFYVPIDNDERECMSPSQINQVARSFDIGGHGYNHINLTRIPIKEAQKEIREAKDRLEEIIGRNVVCLCYPWGACNARIVDIVADAGYIGARTTKSLTRNIKNPFKMSATINATNWWFAPYIKHAMASLDVRLFGFLLRNNLFFESWDRIAIATLDFVVDNGGVWHLWGHSWEIDSHDDWGKLEELLRRISALPERVTRVNNSQLIRILDDKRR
jgi:peptidoglycan/xylan/chitin deacetylase (PgdA/CDA1 family)